MDGIAWDRKGLAEMERERRSILQRVRDDPMEVYVSVAAKLSENIQEQQGVEYSGIPSAVRACSV